MAKQLTQVQNIEAVRALIEPPFTPEGIPVVLVDDEKVRFRIRRNEGDVYYGIIDGGKSAVMNSVTGQFNIGG